MTTSKIPQLLITLGPDGQLQAEIPINGVRRVVQLTMAKAGQQLHRMLLAQQARIDGDRARAKRVAPQPDWVLIAKHPQVEIRQMLPGRGLDASHQVLKDKTLEDLGL